MRRLALAAATLGMMAGAAPPGAAEAPMPRYAHIFVIIEENQGFDRIIGSPDAPNLTRLARRYGLATQFYGEVHPSEGNYIALLGGDTFGIHDDDANFCRPGVKDTACEKSDRPDYVDHTVTAPSLMAQLEAKGLTWKGYFEDIPAPGSDAVRWPRLDKPVPGKPAELYAMKHNGFMNFKSVQDDPVRAAKIVGFDQLGRDLKAGTLPAYAHIVPNQCNEMHGLDEEPNIPADCRKGNLSGRIRRGDKVTADLVTRIMRSRIWRSRENSAIVVTFDEDHHPKDGAAQPQGCCASDPRSAAKFGGGRIPTIVITNHGPRGLSDPMPYNHYSLLRTTEAAFGLSPFLGHAADEGAGVVAMTPLFASGK